MIIESIALNDPMRLIGTLSTLTGEFRISENALLLRQKGLSEKEIQKQAKAITTSGYSQQGFNFRRKDGIFLALKNYTGDEIKRIIAFLIKSDNELKKAGSDAKETFEDIVYTIIINGGKEKKAELYTPLEVKLV